MEQSHIPKPPKASTVSKRLFLAMGCAVLLIAVLFVFFVNHYTPKDSDTNTNTANSNQHPATDDTALTIINSIKNEPHHPTLISQAAKNTQGSSMYQYAEPVNTDMSFSAEDFKNASNAKLSVFKNNSIANNGGLSHGSTLHAGTMPKISANGRKIPGQSRADTYGSQNMQTEKTAFVKDTPSAQDTIEARLQRPLSPYELNAGTIIPSTLITGINSDLPGQITASVRRNIYDSVTGNYLLIPQGTKVIGVYDSHVAYGQSRVLIVWNRLIFPNGTSFDLKGMPGADLSGYAGLSDQVDNHYFKIFGSALMMSAFGVTGQLSQPQNNSNQLTSQQLIYGAVGQQMSQTAMQMVAKNMNIQPTIKIRPGDSFNVLLTRDMVLPHPYRN